MFSSGGNEQRASPPVCLRGEMLMIKGVPSECCDLASRLTVISVSQGPFVINPEHTCRGEADRCHAPPDPLGLMSDFSEVVNQGATKPATDERADSDGQEREAHVSALLSGRREARNVFVVTRRQNDFTERQH